MINQDFWDFVMTGGYELLFPDDEGKQLECQFCGRVIKGDEKVEWVDKLKGILKCPDCGEQLEDK